MGGLVATTAQRLTGEERAERPDYQPVLKSGTCCASSAGHSRSLGPMPPNYEQWRETCDTLHAHTQVLGKLAAKLAPPEPQLQHAALRLTARGWETLPLPAPDRFGIAGRRP